MGGRKGVVKMDFLEQVQQELLILPQQINNISNDFQQAMQSGLAKQPSSLKMLPSFLDTPSGTEHGIFLALDFGGTNIRVIVVELLGQGIFRIKKHISKPMVASDGSYNYITDTVTAEQLFDFLAEQIGAVVEENESYGLGHTFSFPCCQNSVNSALLLHWTKEINTQGVEGQDVNVLLQQALVRKRLHNVNPLAIINDTVGTLLTAAYSDLYADIGSICGTGHNTCYVQPLASGNSMIINMESGNFNKLPRTKYDLQLDCSSDKPGEQILEKMTAGKYLGELCRLILLDCARPGLLDRDFFACYSRPYSLTTERMVKFSGKEGFNINTYRAVEGVAAALIKRSAQLVAATYLGILQHIDGTGIKHHTIAIDGSLYEKIPGYKQVLEEVLIKNDNNKGRIKLVLSKDGSGVGAAIAAASVSQAERNIS